ncbi:hypothetical protein [Streptomyces sp. NPDC002082]|uniref:hypothetical protein n=1 Tax=Streptomyces sp. NPDC002082 TaxID=3154772 RepID=UPI00332B81A8
MNRSRVLGAAALALAVGFGVVGVIPAAAGPAAPGELTIAPPPHEEPASRPLLSAGTGLLTVGAGGARFWQSRQDGRVAPVKNCSGGSDGWTAYHADSVGCGAGTSGTLTINDLAAGKTETLTLPQGRAWTQTFSATQVLTKETDKDGWAVLHLLGRESEPRKDVVVAAPEKIGSQRFQVRASDAQGALVSYWSTDTTERVALLDFATATLRPMPLPAGQTRTDHINFGLGSKWIAMERMGAVVLRARADLGVTRTVALRSFDTVAVQPVGDWLVTQFSNTPDEALVALPVNGGAKRTLLTRTADTPLVPGADGAAHVAGGSDSTHWGIQSVTPGPDGVPVVKQSLRITPNPADRVGLTFAQGQLAISQADPERGVRGHSVSLSSPASVSRTPAWRCDEPEDEPACGFGGVATGDGRLISLSSEDNGTACYGCVVVANVRDMRAGGAVRHVRLASKARIQPLQVVQASGRYVLFGATENSSLRFLVADIEAGKILDAKAVAQSALWGSTLWSPEGDKGVVAGTDLRSGKVTRRVDLRSGCKPFELKVNGDWFYSTCSAYGDGPAVYHALTKKRIRLPFTPEAFKVELGDGYVVQDEGIMLEITNLRSGAPVRERNVEGVFPDGFGRSWTIDPFGSRLAYTDRAETVHIVGITGKTSALTAIDRSIPTSGAWSALSSKRWAPQVWLSKPAASWTLAVTNKATGKVVRTLTGGEVRGLLQPMKDGRETSGGFALPDGAYTWALTVKPADGQGAELALSGPLNLTGSTGGGALPTP